MFVALPFRRLLAITTAISMILPGFATAQDLTGNAPGGGAPPARVGEISGVSGSVSFNGAGTGGWAAASLNYPVSAGDSLYTQQGAQAAVALDASTITLAENTELQITGLNDQNFGATESQGEIFLDMENLAPGTSYVIATPRGSVTIAQDGRYGILAGDQNSPTVVNVFAGAATVTDPGATVQVAAGQAATLTGTDQTVAQLGQAQPDGFAQALLGRTAAAPPSYAPAVVGQMTGGYQLAQYGSWNPDPDYGAVWYPRVDAGWAPYREGHWADVPPWGYTWVENEPWGFAPFHYGRWIDRDGRWGWIAADRDEGRDDRPVYAPAVVSFFGLGLGVGLTIGALSSRSIGWVPLGPREAFRPYYHSSDDYDRRINAHDVRDLHNVNFHDNRDFAPDHFANRRGATYLPADAMGRGDSVARFGHPVDKDALTKARPMGGDVSLPRADVQPARQHPAQAPHPTAFAERHELPRATVMHQPGADRPGLASPDRQPPGFQKPDNRPAFGANPGYHPPPPPPGFGGNDRPRQPQVFNQGGNDFHPQNGQRQQMPQVYHPDQQGLPPVRPLAPQHQPMPQVYQPGNGGGQPFHPQGQGQQNRQPAAQRPPMPNVARPENGGGQPFHPQQGQGQGQQFRQPAAPRAPMPQVYQPQMPQAQPFHPQQEFRPQQQARPPQPQFRPPAPAFAPQQFHPQPMQQPQQPHFNPPPQPRPEPPQRPDNDRPKHPQ